MKMRMLVSLGVLCFLVIACLGCLTHVKAATTCEPAIGQIGLFPYAYSPAGWRACDGGSLPINQNQALFALIGSAFGGNGTTDFNLPNLKGKGPSEGLNYHMATEGVTGVDGVEALIGEVCLFPDKVISMGEGSKNWRLCDGSSLNIVDYQALYASIGNTHGGDGHTTLKIPDLKDKCPIPGVSYYIAVNGTFPTPDGGAVEDFLGAVNLYALPFVPCRNFKCDGATKAIPQNAALFSLLSTQFGGDGRSTFAVPNLVGKEPSKSVSYSMTSSGLYPPRP